MRKKSHILLARYLADQMTASESLQSHRKAFCLGSILPDIKPSFITKRHEFYGTFHEVQEKLKVLVEDGTDRYKERVFWRRMGEIFHYIADYFTFPHNRTFTGTLVEDNSYEKELKNQLAISETETRISMQDMRFVLPALNSLQNIFRINTLYI